MTVRGKRKRSLVAKRAKRQAERESALANWVRFVLTHPDVAPFWLSPEQMAAAREEIARQRAAGLDPKGVDLDAMIRELEGGHA